LLSADRTPEVLAALMDALSDKDWSVRAASVHALALRNDPALLPNVSPLIDDKKEAVRLRAAAACLRLESLKSAPARRAPAKATDKKQ
jgi:HEAT repeat protein